MPTSMFGPQTVITGGSFHQNNVISKGSFDRLLEAASPAAFHNSDDRRDAPKCHRKTRVAVLQKIMDCIHGLDMGSRDAAIIWLYGPAGSGKSAIAQSITECCYQEGLLVASYFFSRFDSTRNHGRSLVATIAYQVSLRFPDIRDHMIRMIDHDPFIFTRSVDAQILSLIIEPLQERINAGYFNTPAAARVVVIDGLNECKDRDGQLSILSAISGTLQKQHLSFIFLIASRPDHDIRTAFGFGYLKDISILIPLDDKYLPSDDICVFLQDKFAEIKQTHPFRAHIPPTWPSDNILRALVKKSSGQFIYASTVVKFVTSSRHPPTQRLDVVLGILPAHRDMPFAELDALYMHIFSSVVDREPTMQIIALHLLSPPKYCSVQDMEDLLSLNSGDVSVLLCDLSSLISVEEHKTIKGEPWDTLCVFHASLEDFLLDKSRSHDFWINARALHAEFAHLLFQMKDRMKNRYNAVVNLLHHISKAVPIPELHDDLMKFSFTSILMEVGGSYRNLISLFFTSIKQLNFEDGAAVYDYQLQQFDKMAQEKMEQMYSDSSLAALVSITGSAILYRHHLNGMSNLFLLDDERKALDNLSFSSFVWLSPEYQHFLLKFLEDPSRSGIYMLNGESSIKTQTSKTHKHALDLAQKCEKDTSVSSSSDNP